MTHIILPLALLMFMPWNTSIFWLPTLFMLGWLNLFSPMSCITSFTPMVSIDSNSTLMIQLSIWISMLMLISSMKIYYSNFKSDKFLLCTIILCLILIFAFSMNSMFSFYIFFEASLIPTLIIIMVWGYQPERLEAGMYMMMYTLTASLPLLMSILMMMSNLNTLSFYIQSHTSQPHILSLTLLLAFLVKLPMYLTHLWLPKAHVEAPVAGSMILAGILLKLGAYGLMRIMIMYPLLLSPPLKTLLISLSIWGAIITTILCMRQLDMKSMIAYSSISHMAILMAGLLTYSTWGLDGALMMMIAHGLTSSGLFCMANMYYENTYSRNLIINKGFLFISPSMSLGWFLLLACNMSTPPTINLLAEIMLIQSIISNSVLITPLLLLPPIFTLVYSMILYTSMHHGPPSLLINIPRFIPSYYTTILLHTSPSFLLIMSVSLLST